MTTLAVDTSGSIGAVSLLLGTGEIHECSLGAKGGHLVELAKGVSTLLRRAKRTAQDVRRIGLVIGPGSFTGLRIGLAWSKGWVAATGADLVVMGTLELIAHPHVGRLGEPVCVAVHAGRGEIYCGVYEARDAAAGGVGAVVDSATRTPDEFVRLLPAGAVRVVGNAAGTLDVASESTLLDVGADEVGDGSLAARLARLAGGLDPVDPGALRGLEPMYLRASYARSAKLRTPRSEGESPCTSD